MHRSQMAFQFVIVRTFKRKLKKNIKTTITTLDNPRIYFLFMYLHNLSIDYRVSAAVKDIEHRF